MQVAAVSRASELVEGMPDGMLQHVAQGPLFPLRTYDDGRQATLVGLAACLVALITDKNELRTYLLLDRKLKTLPRHRITDCNTANWHP